MTSHKSPQIGKSIPRIDALDKLTGSAQFTDDIPFGPGLLHARVKRSPHAHAMIKSINLEKARALPGVKVVISGEGFDGYIGLYLQDRQLFARDRVRFIGEPIAAVAATTEEIAEAALDLIEIEYEVLEPVFDPLKGAKDDAPLVHPDMHTYTFADFIFPKPGTNISNHFKVRKGDVEGAWAECDAIVEREFHIPHIQHVPMEPHAAVAKMDTSGKITLWASSQSPFAQRNLIAKTLGISQSDIQVIAPYVGGGFGCKAGVTMEALPVAIAMHAKGRPVRMVLTREEEFTTNFVRQAMVIRLKVGCDAEGRLLAMENTMYWDGGAYTEYGVNIARAAGYSCTGPYDIPNVKADSFCVYTNHTVGGPYRGFGMSEIHTGINQCMDELAEKISMDKVEFLALNCIEGGDILSTGMVMHPTGLSECLNKTAEGIDWGSKSEPSAPNKRRGKGIAMMWKAPAMTPNAGSSALLEMNEDGTASLGVGGQEIGQGTFTAMAQIAAETLGISTDEIRVRGPIDTSSSPYEWQTVASRLTWSMGNAVAAAAADARKQVLDLAAEHWDEDVKNLDIVNSTVISYQSEQEMPLKDMVIYGLPKDDDQGWIGGPIVGRGSFMPTYVTGLDKDTGQGDRAVVHYTTGAQAVEVEVDLETGKLDIIQAVSAFDVGKAINPELVRTQIEGGFIQGLSSAIFEELVMQDGQVRNPSFVDYRIATSVDIPEKIKTFIVEVPQDDGPFGARGVGEHPMVPTIAALANAVQDAIGLRFEGPPFSAEKIFLAMVEAGIVE